MKTERIRIELWASLRPVVEREIESTGLSASEVINVAVMQYFGITPQGKQQPNPVVTTASSEVIPNNIPMQDTPDEDDFL